MIHEEVQTWMFFAFEAIEPGTEYRTSRRCYTEDLEHLKDDVAKGVPEAKKIHEQFIAWQVKRRLTT